MSGAEDDVPPPRTHDLDAAEYVIGLLSPDEARAVKARALSDRAMAASVLAWQRRLSPLTSAVPPVTPPLHVWQRLELSAGLQQATQAVRQVIPKQQQRRWDFWTGSFVGAVCGVAIAFAIVTPKLLSSQPAVAALTAPNALTPAFLVMVTKDGYATIIATAADVQPGNSLELWGFPEGATVPISLGVLPANGRLKMKAIVPAGTMLLVSSEPLGGSTTGALTGPVVYSGRMVRG